MKIVRRPKLSAALQVIRYITDPQFAESLSGVPRGLKCKRLEWLDAHPGQLHVTTKSDIEGCYIVRRKWLAGTPENVIAIAGYSEKMFTGKMIQRTRPYHGYGITVGNGAYMTRLMRGHFEIRTQTVDEKTDEQIRAAQQPPRPSHLRLVVDNRSPRE